MDTPKTDLVVSPMKLDIIGPPKNSLRDVLRDLVRLNSTGLFHEVTCAFCRSPQREAAEQLYENPVGAGSREAALQALFSNAGESLSLEVIRNHIDYHRTRAAEELRKLEYIEHLSSICETEQRTLGYIRLMLAALLERQADIGSMPAETMKAKSSKTASTVSIAKAAATLLELQAKILGEMAKRGEVIALPRQAFRLAMERALQAAKNPDEQKLLLSVFEEMSQTGSDVLVGGVERKS